MKHLLCALALSCLPAWAGVEAVTIPDAGGGIELKGHLYRPEGRGPFPGIVMLHGCSGMWTPSGKPLPSHQFWAERFRSLGYAAAG